MAIKPYPKKNKTYYAIVVEGINKYSGKRIQKLKAGIQSLPKAQKIEKALWVECRNEMPESYKIQTWGRLVEKYLDDFKSQLRINDIEGFSPKTFETKKSRLAHVVKWHEVELSQITLRLVKYELDNLESSGISKALTKEILKEIKAVLNFAVEIGVLKSNPVSKMKRKTPGNRLTCLTAEEVNLLLHEAKIQRHPYYPVWLLSVFTGMRRSELAALKWTDIDFKERLISVNKQLIPGEGIIPYLKNQRARKVPLNKSLVSILKETKLKSNSDVIIDMPNKDWINGHQSRVLREFCRKIGITCIRHHDLRATFITQMLADNKSLAKLKEIVGHEKLSTTDGYLRSAGLNLRGETDDLGFKIPQTNEGEIIQISNS